MKYIVNLILIVVLLSSCSQQTCDTSAFDAGMAKFERNKEKLFASNVSHVGILVTPLPKTSTEFIDKWILMI